MKYPLFVAALLAVPLMANSEKYMDDKLQNESKTHSENVSFGSMLSQVKALLAKENYRGAFVELKKLSELDEKNPEVWQLLGMAAHKKGDFLRSKVAFEKALELNPDDQKAVGLQADLFLSIGDKQSARNNLNKLKELCPTGCPSRERIATALSQY